MSQITHTLDKHGHYIQIVTPETLREALDADGEDYSRPKHFSSYDEWDVGPEWNADPEVADAT